MTTKVTGVVLAGGQGRRMAFQDKGLVKFHGEPLVVHAAKALAEVADEVMINANRNLEQYRQLGFEVVTDQTDSFDGPLAGLLSAMQHVETGILLVMPCDSPIFSSKHLSKLLKTLREQNADVAVACLGEKLQPVFLAVKTNLNISLKNYLASGQRKLADWLTQQHLVRVDFSDHPDIFANINTLEDLQSLESSTLQQS